MGVVGRPLDFYGFSLPAPSRRARLSGETSAQLAASTLALLLRDACPSRRLSRFDSSPAQSTSPVVLLPLSLDAASVLVAVSWSWLWMPGVGVDQRRPRCQSVSQSVSQ